MMKIKLICVGKTNFNFLKSGEEEYSKRLTHYCSYARIDIPELKQVKSFSQEEIKLREGELILSKIQSGEYVILLDDKGKSFNSIAFANYLEKKALHGSSAITFIIGGAYGFSPAVYAKADEQISLSEMTFSHQIIRLIFLEQIYRAFTIIKGEKYHHA